MSEIPTGFVRFQVNGKIYDILIENLKKYESTLSNMVLEKTEHKDAIPIDEDSTIFEAVLNYHRTGLMIQPSTLSFELWLNRSAYWGLGLHAPIQTECYYMLDYIRYFGQRFIKEYNPHTQTIVWNEDSIMSITGVRYDEQLPFFLHSDKYSKYSELIKHANDFDIYLIQGCGSFTIAGLKCDFDENKNDYESFWFDSSILFENSISYTNYQIRISTLRKKLEKSIEFLLKGCKRNKKIEDAFWEQYLSDYNHNNPKNESATQELIHVFLRGLWVFFYKKYHIYRIIIIPIHGFLPFC